MSAREEIAAAASTVDGVNVSPFYRQVTKPGDGVVRLDRIDYPDKFGGVCTWQVAVVLPQDYPSSERWIEEKTDELVAALAEELEVRSVTAIETPLPDSGSVPVLVIEGLRRK